MSGNILFYLFITILVVVIYKYYDGLFFYIKPYFDKSREENMAKIKSKPRPREEMSNNKNNIITEMKELTNIPFDFLYNLCVTYGIFPIKKVLP